MPAAPAGIKPGRAMRMAMHYDLRVMSTETETCPDLPLTALRAWLHAHAHRPGEVMSRGNQGLVLRFEHSDCRLIIKHAAGNRLSRPLHQAALRREYRAYRRLAGVPGLPHCHGLLDGRYLLLQPISGMPLRQATLPDHECFYARLLEIIQAMHKRGVAHGDLKRKANIMVDDHAQPVILDLGTAILRRHGWHPIRNRLFEFARRTDLNAWVKHKYGGYDQVTGPDRQYLDRSRLERLLSTLRR